jgi:thiopurine S-methyltransferase
LNKDFWDARWQQGQLGFHQAAPHPALDLRWAEFLSWLGPSNTETLRCLVPLCGKSPDLTWLAQRCQEVVGVEFVEQAVRDYFTEMGVPAERAEAPLSYAHGNTRLVVADYFRLRAAELGPLQVAYDRAALVAIEPQKRAAYLAQTLRLLAPRAGLFLISFEHDTGSGPPFSVDDLLPLLEQCRAEGLLKRHELVSNEDILEQEPRFRERGATFMKELIWFVQKSD